MEPMRYAKRNCEDREKIERFLCTARVGHLGLSDDTQPYVIPLNFVWHNGNIYFHAAESGRKADIIKRNPQVCFTVCEEYGTIADPVPALTDTSYMSAMVFGTIHRVNDLQEMREALQHLLNKYVPGYYDQPLSEQHVLRYRSSLNSAVAVYCIVPQHVTAKDSPLREDRMFYPGRTAAGDVGHP